jgi:hypothetical protein
MKAGPAKVWINGAEYTFPSWVSSGIIPPLPPLVDFMTPAEREAARLRGLADALTQHFGNTDPRLS